MIELLRSTFFTFPFGVSALVGAVNQVTGDPPCILTTFGGVGSVVGVGNFISLFYFRAESCLDKREIGLISRGL